VLDIARAMACVKAGYANAYRAGQAMRVINKSRVFAIQTACTKDCELRRVVIPLHPYSIWTHLALVILCPTHASLVARVTVLAALLRSIASEFYSNCVPSAQSVFIRNF
jgi:hypothetical protein